MPSVTYDGRSFSVDGRRLWLVSGSLPYARVPREDWAARIRACKAAGLNTIETPVVWAEHEPRPKQFDFKGDRDVRAFVELVGAAGMHVILRPGPYVGVDWDFGGLPAWLATQPEIAFRTANARFLEHVSKFFSKLAEQVKGLQVTSAGAGGPILLVQNESHYTCGSAAMTTGYLNELNRYLREAGLSVPTVNNHNLWAGIEGEIDGWVGSEHLLATLRQLRQVRPNQPKLVLDFPVGRPKVWGEAAADPVDPAAVQRRLAEVLAGGGQFNIQPMLGGTSFGFNAGRSPRGIDRFYATSHDQGSPLTEDGRPGACYGPVKRICTFASQFGRVLAGLDAEYHPIVADPNGGHRTQTVSVSHAQGAQGHVVFVFGPDPVVTGKRPGRIETTVLLPDGTSLPVSLGSQAVVWLLLDTHIHGRSHLDYCTFNALAAKGSVFVCYAAAGSEGLISINGSVTTIEAPKGKQPNVFEHEGLTVAVCNEAQADTLLLTDDGVYVGASMQHENGTVLAAPGYRKPLRVREDATLGDDGGAPPKVGTAPKFGEWDIAPATEAVSGTSPRYAAIDGPETLTNLGSPHGYGWYRVELNSPSAKKTKIIAPRSGDRLGLLLDGEPVGTLGVGPGSEREITLPLKKGEQTLVVLADNMGRFAGGSRLGDLKGLFGHLYEPTSFKVPKGKIETKDPMEVLPLRSPLWEVRDGDTTEPDRVNWTFTHRKKSPIIVEFEPVDVRALILLNDEVIGYLDRSGPVYLVLEQEGDLNRGKNVLELALLPDSGFEVSLDAASALKHFASTTSFYEGSDPLTDGAPWAFAKWEPPADEEFVQASRSAISSATSPTWWRTRFTLPAGHGSVHLDPTGMTKGQIYLNGRNVGRYFVGLGGNKLVPGQAEYYLPSAWMDPSGENELMLFDEHGGNPARSSLVRR